MTNACHLIELQLLPDEQFRLHFGNESQTGSLYYLGIDPESAEYDCSAEQGLSHLFSRWITLLQEQPFAKPLYLPFDFADECTRWLACEKSNSNVQVVSGWAPVEGWAVSPSDFHDHAQSLTSFQPDEPLRIQTFYLPRVLADLRRVVGELNPGSPPTQHQTQLV